VCEATSCAPPFLNPKELKSRSSDSDYMPCRLKNPTKMCEGYCKALLDVKFDCLGMLVRPCGRIRFVNRADRGVERKDRQSAPGAKQRDPSERRIDRCQEVRRRS